MVFTRLGKAAAFGLVAASAVTLGVTGAMAQGKDKKDQPAGEVWYKLCNEVPVADQQKPGEPPKQQDPKDMKKVTICVTQADVRDAQTAILISKIAIRQVKGQEKPDMVAMVPLHPNLPPLAVFTGARAVIDSNEKDQIKLAYTLCGPTGCFAESILEPAFLDQLKKGKFVIYAGADATGGRARTFQVPLEGFGKAFDGAPKPMEQYTEEQKKMDEFIRQRVADLRKQAEEAAKNGQGQPAAATKPEKKK
jgi:invasion protein IalB